MFSLYLVATWLKLQPRYISKGKWFFCPLALANETLLLIKDNTVLLRLFKSF